MKLVERVQNVAKKKRSNNSDSTAAPPAKRERPPKNKNPTLERYPPLQMGGTVDENAAEALRNQGKMLFYRPFLIVGSTPCLHRHLLLTLLCNTKDALCGKLCMLWDILDYYYGCIILTNQVAV